MSVRVYKRGKQWYTDVQHHGQRIRVAVGSNKDTAMDAAKAIEGDLVRGRFHLAQLKPGPPFERVAEQYAEWAKQNKRSWGKSDRFKQHALLTYFRGKPITALTPWLIEKYKLWRKERVKPATINRELSILSHLFTKAIEWGHLAEHPMKGGKVKKLPGETMRERIITIEEEARLLAEASDTLRPLVILALDTGTRRGEILGLTWDRVELRQGEILLTQTKNGRYRRVPLTDRARHILQANATNATPTGHVFTRGNGQPLRSIREAFLGACERAKLIGLRFHDLRHTFATRLATSGVDIVTVQRLLGHQTLAMTQRYAHPTSADMRRAIQSLNHLDRMRHNRGTVDIRRQAVVCVSPR